MISLKEKQNNKPLELGYKNKGFTLIEALVAISILMIAIASPMTLAQKGLSTATLSKDQMIASFLVQDGIEAVRNIRDYIAIRGTDQTWLDNNGLLGSCICHSDPTCNFDSLNESSEYCTIDTTLSWDQNSISKGGKDPAKLKISYTEPVNLVRHFLKYDYHLNTSPEDPKYPYESKFTRLINIKKTSHSATGDDEAVVHVRVSWNSASGVQNIDVSNFIYNYSDNY